MPAISQLERGGEVFCGRHRDPDYDRTQIGSQPRPAPRPSALQRFAELAASVGEEEDDHLR